MRKVISKQTGVPFIFCPHPITIDKRSEWGDNDENIQRASDGAFLKIDDTRYIVTHLVQPNADKSAPVGWVRTPGDHEFTDGIYDKAPIWVEDTTALPANTEFECETLDGVLKYKFDEPCYIVYNCDAEGNANLNDKWPMKVSTLTKLYNIY